MPSLPSVLLFLTTAILSSFPPPTLASGLKIHFTRYADQNCTPSKQIGDNKKTLHNNHCYNFQERQGFLSYSYTRAQNNPNKNRWAYMYSLPDCNVAVYSESDCRGQRYFMGPYPVYEDKCGGGYPFFGRSVGVACDKAHDYDGRKCETWCPGSSTFDGQGQCDAVGVRHNGSEGKCCEEGQPCEMRRVGGRWKQLGCLQHREVVLERGEEVAGEIGMPFEEGEVGIVEFASEEFRLGPDV